MNPFQQPEAHLLLALAHWLTGRREAPRHLETVTVPSLSGRDFQCNGKTRRVEVISDIRASESFHQKVSQAENSRIGIRLANGACLSASSLELARRSASNRVTVAVSQRCSLPCCVPLFPRLRILRSGCIEANAGKRLAATIGYYQMVANRSLDEFDQIVDQRSEQDSIAHRNLHRLDLWTAACRLKDQLAPLHFRFGELAKQKPGFARKHPNIEFEPFLNTA